MNNFKSQAVPRSWWNRPTLWLACWLLPALVILAGFLLREWTAQNAVQQRLEELRLVGKPIDNASMELVFVSSTSTHNTVAWNEVAYLASGWASTMGQDLPYLAGQSLPVAALVDGQWPESARANEFLLLLEPFFRRLHELADKSSGPVWQPIQFSGVGTLLGSIQESRSIGDLLALDFDYAVFVKDRQRAVRDLKTMRAVIEAYNWDTFFVVELASFARTHVLHDAIARSLQADLWSAEELVTVRSLVAPPIDVAKRWSKIFDFELAASLATIRDASNWPAEYGTQGLFMGPFSRLPSSQLRFLQDMQQIQLLGQNDLKTLWEVCRSFDQHRNHGTIASIYAPAVGSIAKSYVSQEESRRILIAAIALKCYQLRHGSYPGKLDAVLEDKGIEITRTELEGVNHAPIGYQVDGQQAYVWNSPDSDIFSFEDIREQLDVDAVTSDHNNYPFISAIRLR